MYKKSGLPIQAVHFEFNNLLNRNVVYSFVTRNYLNTINVDDLQICSGQYEEEKDFVGWCSSEKVRLFRTIFSDKIRIFGSEIRQRSAMHCGTVIMY